MPAAAVCFVLEVFAPCPLRGAAFFWILLLARGTFSSFASLGAGLSCYASSNADAFAFCRLLGVKPGRFEAGRFAHSGRSCLVSPRLLGFRVGVAHGSGCPRSCRSCFITR